MYLTFLRSSAIGGHEWCEWKYALSSVLGCKDVSGQSAQLGTIVHKALELLARRKKAEQEGGGEVVCGELARSWPAHEVKPQVALHAAWEHYTHPARTTHDWGEAHWQQAQDHLVNVLDSHYNPLLLEVVQPEQYFDLEVRRPWSHYHYVLPDGRHLKGRLRLKGTMDLVTRSAPGVIEYVDWKTGRRYDWGKQKEKDFDLLRKDRQFLLYYYALRHLYPGEHVLFTVYYTRDGGAYTIFFDDSDLLAAEEMVREQFQRIRANEDPSWVRPSWKCRICEFDKQQEDGTSLCQARRQELVQLGWHGLLEKRGKFDNLSSYGEGGGSSGREKA